MSLSHRHVPGIISELRCVCLVSLDWRVFVVAVVVVVIFVVIDVVGVIDVDVVDVFAVAVVVIFVVVGVIDVDVGGVGSFKKFATTTTRRPPTSTSTSPSSAAALLASVEKKIKTRFRERKTGGTNELGFEPASAIRLAQFAPPRRYQRKVHWLITFNWKITFCDFADWSSDLDIVTRIGSSLTRPRSFKAASLAEIGTKELLIFFCFKPLGWLDTQSIL